MLPGDRSFGRNVDRCTDVLLAETIYVKVLVDEEERTVERFWQQRLKDRLDGASAIINEYCDIRFAVAEFDSWQSDNHENDLRTHSARV